MTTRLSASVSRDANFLIEWRFGKKISASNRAGMVVLQGDNFPFPVRRTFLIEKMGMGEFRGGHAHKKCHQLFQVTSGMIRLRLIKHIAGKEARGVFDMSAGEVIAHVLPHTWLSLEALQPDTTVLVYASHDYDPGDYIESLGQLRRLSKK